MSDAEFKEVARDNPDAAAAYSFWDGKKTFKPIKNPQTKKQHELQKTIKATMQATLGGGELRKTVKLPEGEDENEWIAVNCALALLFLPWSLVADSRGAGARAPSRVLTRATVHPQLYISTTRPT
jgi:hypothetical protein